jgi:hypothetical protein
VLLDLTLSGFVDVQQVPSGDASSLLSEEEKQKLESWKEKYVAYKVRAISNFFFFSHFIFFFFFFLFFHSFPFLAVFVQVTGLATWSVSIVEFEENKCSCSINTRTCKENVEIGRNS